jgi:hypothetical protein
MMTVFENCAVRAYGILVTEKITDDPHEAWRLAAPSFTKSINVQRKLCPIATFSGLWYAGKMKGSIPRSHYKALTNTQYAIDGIKEIKGVEKQSTFEQVSGVEAHTGHQ